MRRRRSGGSGRGRRGVGSSSGKHRRDDDDAVEGGDEGGEDSGDEGEGDGEDERLSSSSSGKRRRRGGSGRARGGGDEPDRKQIEAEKKKVQTVLVVAGAAGILMIIVLAVVLSGGGETHETGEGDDSNTPTFKRVEVPSATLDQVKALFDEGTNSLRAAEGLDGDSKVAKLKAAKWKFEEATNVVNTWKNKVPEANRGESFSRFDSYEEGIAKALITVRKLLLEYDSNNK